MENKVLELPPILKNEGEAVVVQITNSGGGESFASMATSPSRLEFGPPNTFNMLTSGLRKAQE